MVAQCRGRREIRDRSGGADAGHPRRGQRSFLCHPRTAEIPQDRSHRGRSDPRGGTASRDGAARHRLHPRGRGTRAGDMGRISARRSRTIDTAWRYSRRGFSQQRDCRARRARGRDRRRFRRRAVAHPRQCARTISVRQRPPGARQADPGRGTRGLLGLSAARPPSHRGAVRDARSAGGRRQRASCQDGSAFPQCRAGTLADRPRAQGRPGARRPAHRRQCRRRSDLVVPPGVLAATRQLGLAALAGLSRQHRAVVRLGGDRLCRARSIGVRRRHADRRCALRIRTGEEDAAAITG